MRDPGKEGWCWALQMIAVLVAGLGLMFVAGLYVIDIVSLLGDVR